MHRSGEAVWAVATRVGVSKATAYRWWSEEQKAKGPSAIEFASLVRSSTVVARGLVLEVGAARIRVEAGFDAQLLRSVVETLTRESES